MILERTNNEILVRLPLNFDISELQNLLDFIKFKENAAASKATQQEADELSDSVNRSMWAKFKAKRNLQ